MENKGMRKAMCKWLKCVLERMGSWWTPLNTLRKKEWLPSWVTVCVTQ